MINLTMYSDVEDKVASLVDDKSDVVDSEWYVITDVIHTSAAQL